MRGSLGCECETAEAYSAHIEVSIALKHNGTCFLSRSDLSLQATTHSMCIYLLMLLDKLVHSRDYLLERRESNPHAVVVVLF
jgi:hypothetical protein